MAKRPHVFDSTIKSAAQVKKILSENFEEGRQDKCKEQVFRNIIKPGTGMSRRTFFRMLKMPDSTPTKNDDPNQLKLFE